MQEIQTTTTFQVRYQRRTYRMTFSIRPWTRVQLVAASDMGHPRTVRLLYGYDDEAVKKHLTKRILQLLQIAFVKCGHEHSRLEYLKLDLPVGANKDFQLFIQALRDFVENSCEQELPDVALDEQGDLEQYRRLWSLSKGAYRHMPMTQRLQFLQSIALDQDMCLALRVQALRSLGAENHADSLGLLAWHFSDRRLCRAAADEFACLMAAFDDYKVVDCKVADAVLTPLLPKFANLPPTVAEVLLGALPDRRIEQAMLAWLETNPKLKPLARKKICLFLLASHFPAAFDTILLLYHSLTRHAQAAICEKLIEYLKILSHSQCSTAALHTIKTFVQSVGLRYEFLISVSDNLKYIGTFEAKEFAEQLLCMYIDAAPMVNALTSTLSVIGDQATIAKIDEMMLGVGEVQRIALQDCRDSIEMFLARQTNEAPSEQRLGCPEIVGSPSQDKPHYSLTVT